MLRKKRFLIGGIIVFIAMGYLGYSAFVGAATYYYKVGEFLALESSVYGQNVRVNGIVVAGSVEREAQGTVVRFTVADAEGGGSLPVSFQGVVPDTFKEGGEVVIEGQLNADGIFQAHTLMAKCPSRYEAEG